MSPTASATSPFQPASGEVHSWCVRLDVPPEASAGLYATLTHDEQNRSARLRFEHDRQRFIVAHGVLRNLLGRYLGIHPCHVRFVSNPFGKPALNPEFGGRLEFNLSHSADLALIAIAADADVGVDLECIRAQPDYAEIARRFFSKAEVDQLNELPSHLHAQAFFSCWTKKEAYVKARGEGLTIPLTSFSVPLTTDPAHAPVDLAGALNDGAPARQWSLYTLQPAPGYVGALAIEGSDWRLSQWQWPDGR
jgi:4'-phosphopantetheinyl transferase